MTTRLRADRSVVDGMVGHKRALVMAASRFGRMEVIATDQGAGRCYRCPCGQQVWSSWGAAESHAQGCEQADVKGAIADELAHEDWRPDAGKP